MNPLQSSPMGSTSNNGQNLVENPIFPQTSENVKVKTGNIIVYDKAYESMVFEHDFDL